MLHLLDANVLIDASRDYYPMDRVPEFWEWLVHVGKHKKVRIPLEIYCELEVGNDQLSSWLRGHKNEMLLHEAVSPQLVAHVINQGYADDLSDEDIEKIGQDPFLIAYAVADVEHRCVVTTERSRPRRERANRHIPDVCRDLGVRCCHTFELIVALDFKTRWNA